MRPHRVRLTHSLVNSYGLSSKMMQCNPAWQTQDEISEFHADGATRLPVFVFFPVLVELKAQLETIYNQGSRHR